MLLTYSSYKSNITNMETASQTKTSKTFPLEIEEGLHKALKHQAIESDMSLHAYIINALVSCVSEETDEYNARGNTAKNREKK